MEVTKVEKPAAKQTKSTKAAEYMPSSKTVLFANH
jgi:hypothetical protein